MSFKSIQDDEDSVFEHISKANATKTNSIDFFNNHLYACVPIIEQYISKALDNRIILSFTKLIENFVVRIAVFLISLFFLSKIVNL